jgi:hypothetical protein
MDGTLFKRRGGGVRFEASCIDEERHSKTATIVLEDNLKNLSLTQEWFEDT